MSFTCGAGLCLFRPDDPERDAYIAADMEQWFAEWKRTHSAAEWCPTLDMQAERIIHLTNTYHTIIAPRSARELHRLRVEDAESEAREEYMRRFVVPEDF